MHYLFTIFLLLLIISRSPLKATEPNLAATPFAELLPTSYNYDTGTNDNLPSPRSLANYYENFDSFLVTSYGWMEKLYQAEADEKMNDNWRKFRRGFLLLNGLLLDTSDFILLNPHTTITNTGVITVHEFAHRTRAAAFGYDSGFNPEYARHGDNPYSFAINLFANGNRTGSTTWNNSTPETLFTHSLFDTPQQRLIEAAAGINQQTNLAANLANRMSLTDNVDMASFFSYSNNSLSYFLYDDSIIPYLAGSSSNPATRNLAGDRAQMINEWRDLGYNFSDKSLARNQFNAFLISGTTWSYLYNMPEYIRTGQRNFKPIRFFGFRMPDFYNYYNVNGPSLNIQTDYKFSAKTFLKLGYESIYSGKTDYKEYKIGISQSFKLANLSANYIINEKTTKESWNLEATRSYKRYGLSLGYQLYNFETLTGERNIDTLRNRNKSSEIYAKLMARF